MCKVHRPAAFRGITEEPWWISTVPGTSHKNRVLSFALHSLSFLLLLLSACTHVSVRSRTRHYYRSRKSRCFARASATSSRQAPEGVDFSGRHSAIPPIERKASEYLTFNPSVAARQFAEGASRVKKASDVLIRQFCPELVSNIISERK